MHNQFCFKELLINARKMKNINEKLNYFDDAFLEFAEFVKEHDEKFYQEVYINLYGDLIGNHFDKKMSYIAVSKMVNEDPNCPSGALYEYEEAMIIGRKYGVTEFNKYTEYDFYVALCMMKSDYFNPSFTDEDYCRLTKQWLEDKDTSAGNEKMWLYWKEIVLGF